MRNATEESKGKKSRMNLIYSRARESLILRGTIHELWKGGRLDADLDTDGGREDSEGKKRNKLRSLSQFVRM